MAARVGSVVVDLVANTAQFEAGMKQAAVTTAATDKMITQKAWQAAHSTRVMSNAMEQFQRRSLGAQASIEGTTAALVAQRFGAGRLTSMLFMMDTAYARVKMRADDATAAIRAKTGAMAASVSSGQIMMQMFGAMALKIGVVVGAIWGLSKVASVFRDMREEMAALQEGTEAYRKRAVEMVKDVWEGATNLKQPIENLYAQIEAGEIALGEALYRVNTLIMERDEQMRREAFDRGREVAVQIQRGIRSRSADFGRDLITGEAVTEMDRQLDRISNFYLSLNQQARTIEDDRLRNAQLAALAQAQWAEMKQVEVDLENDRIESERKAHQERMQHIRDQARAMAELMGRAAGLTLGVGAEAWRAIQEATRGQHADQAHRHLLEQSGALDQDDKRNLREVRDYLRDLLGEWQRMEAQAI